MSALVMTYVADRKDTRKISERGVYVLRGIRTLLDTYLPWSLPICSSEFRAGGDYI